MPKSNKKKKDKAADFTKAKLKLGKGKQLAKNATDTSFKARSITLPHQSIGQNKGDSKPTTRRNLTLDDLLVHLKHYNPTTRKDAIWGIRELLDAHPQLIENSLTPVIQACARAVGDEDAEVRKTLLGFFGWFLPLIPADKIRPHTPLLILFVTSAQTHIFPAIRIDAVRFLDLLLEVTPDAVVHHWKEHESTGGRVLEGYLGLLNAGSSYSRKDDTPLPSSSSVTLSTTSKLVILSSLSSFLRIAISCGSYQDGLGTPSWGSSFSAEEEFLTSYFLIHPQQHITQPEAPSSEIQWSRDVHGENAEDFHGNFSCAQTPSSHLADGFSLDELSHVAQALGASTSGVSATSHPPSDSSHTARIAHSLHPILVSTWLDVAPMVFRVGGGSGGETETQLAAVVGQIAGCLYGAIFRDQNTSPDVQAMSYDDLTVLLRYMSTYLPYILEAGNVQFEQLLYNLSFTYCELTSLAGSLVSLASKSEISALVKSSAPSKLKNTHVVSAQIERVAEYVVSVLDGELISPSHPLGYRLAASSYSTLLPTIWWLLKYRSENEAVSRRVCISTINHAIHTSSNSAVKGVATQFVGTVVLWHSLHQTPLKPHFAFSSDEQECLRKWYMQLPKVLWEVGTGDLLLTEAIICLLLRITQRGSALFDATIIASIRARLIPYFFTTHPQKGEVSGPFTKLVQWSRLRLLILDTVFVLLQDVASPADDDLKVAVDKAVHYTADNHYWGTLIATFHHKSA